MSQQIIASVKVRTGISPSVNVSTGGISVITNSNAPQKVQSVQYIPNPIDYTLAGAGDLEIQNTANNESVLTYDSITQKFVVQNVPRLNGGTF